MDKLNIPINIIRLVDSFLSDRFFAVRVNDQLSTNRSVNVVVSQGSCLSPVLFIIYTNDIRIDLKSSMALFANTMFFSKNKNPNMARCQLQRKVNLVTDWFHRWRLKVKTVTIIFARTKWRHVPLIKLGDTPVTWLGSVKYLGVTIGRQLNFVAHVENTETSCRLLHAFDSSACISHQYSPTQKLRGHRSFLPPNGKNSSRSTQLDYIPLLVCQYIEEM